MKIKIPTEKDLELLIIEEEKIRSSEEYRNECTKVKDISNGWLEITKNIQEKLISDNGYDGVSFHIVLNMLRTAQYLYPNNKIFKEVPVYVRENKANQGKYNIDDIMKHIDVYTINESKISTSEILSNEKLNIIFAGSHT